MKVLVADKFEKSGIDGLKALGCEVISEPDLQGTALKTRLSETAADVLVVRSTKITADIIESSTLSLIIRAGAGFNTIDVESASAKGIYVSNCPGKNSRAVAELAFGLIIACDRHLADNVADIRAGKWNKQAHSKSRGLYGRTLGLIGLGQISQEMVTRGKAFGMNILVHSRWLTSETAAALGVGKADTLEDLASRSDFISAHSALTPETRGVLDDSFFGAMRPGTVFVNTSRGEVVVESALIKAVTEGGIIAGLDVFENEPAGGEGVYEGPLKGLRGVYITHHIGASTDQAQEAVASEAVRIVQEFKRTGIVPNVVNVRKAEIATHLIVVRHVDRVGVLSSVLAVLRDEGASIQEMENIVLSGAKAAIAQIALDHELSAVGLATIRQVSGIFDIAQFPIAK